MKLNLVMRLGIVALMGILLITACSKKSSSSKPKTTYITSASWKFSQAGLDLDSNGTLDLPIPAVYLQTCDIDNIYTFKSDGTGIEDEGASKCTATDPQTTPFSWSLINNDTEINFSTSIFAGLGGSAKIIEVNDSKFTVSKKLAVPGYTALQSVIVVMVH